MGGPLGWWLNPVDPPLPLRGSQLGIRCGPWGCVGWTRAGDRHTQKEEKEGGMKPLDPKKNAFPRGVGGRGGGGGRGKTRGGDGQGAPGRGPH